MIEEGWVAADLAAEFPELRLRYLTLEARSGPIACANPVRGRWGI